MMTKKVRQHLEATGKLAVTPAKRAQLDKLERKRDAVDNGKPERDRAAFARALSRR